ncbi:hypothetical protein D3C81_10860 [compost metagenome]
MKLELTSVEKKEVLGYILILFVILYLYLGLVVDSKPAINSTNTVVVLKDVNKGDIRRGIVEDIYQDTESTFSTRTIDIEGIPIKEYDGDEVRLNLRYDYSLLERTGVHKLPLFAYTFSNNLGEVSIPLGLKEANLTDLNKSKDIYKYLKAMNKNDDYLYKLGKTVIRDQLKSSDNIMFAINKEYSYLNVPRGFLD